MFLLSGRLSAHGARFLAIFAQNLALYNKNNRVLLSQALCVIAGSLGNLMFKLDISPLIIQLHSVEYKYPTVFVLEKTGLTGFLQMPREALGLQGER